MKKIIYLFILLIIIGCDVDNQIEVETEASYYPSSNKNITIDNNKTFRVIKTSDSNITLNIVSPKELYVVVTSHFNNQKISIKSSVSNDRLGREVNTKVGIDYFKTPEKVIDFRENVHNLLHKAVSKRGRLDKRKRVADEVQEGVSSFNFCVDMDEYTYKCTKSVEATARRVVKDIPTKYGNKNLIVWVEDSEYNSGGFLSGGSITQDMVDKLANQFLQNSDNSSFDDDIYDWDTNIYGQEWGSDAKEIDQNLIEASDTIEILIYRMSSNGLAGYFWPKDNFIKSYIPASNEKIMFYINSSMYADNEKETFTTLAHEFQHMIHFYQRDVKLQIEDPTWYNELMSEATEDLLAVKLKHKGPRNVDYRDGSAGVDNNKKGRYPLFNRYNYLSLTSWDNNLINYSTVSSFGAFLLRNYGGAKLLHDMMYSNYSAEDALVDVTKEDFNNLLSKWGEGVILSDIVGLDNSKPRYNFGDFIDSSYGGISYKLGSINFFNYYPEPTFKSSEVINKDANLYYKIGENLSGTIKLNISMPKGGDIAIIAK